MAKRMGLSMSYVHQLEAGKRTPSESVVTLLKILESQVEVGILGAGSPVTEANAGSEELGQTGDPQSHRTIPVIGWAHAGEAENFEELPHSWQDRIPTECRDEKAFAVRLMGDSMEPQYLDGDLLVLMPSREIYSGCLAVLRLANDGVIFRRVEIRGERLRLVPLNPRYDLEDLNRSDVSWAYPVWGMWRQIWR